MPNILHRSNAPRLGLNAASHRAVELATRPPRPQASLQLPQALSHMGLWRLAVRGWVNENGGWTGRFDSQGRYGHDDRHAIYRRIDNFFHSGSDRLLSLRAMEMSSLPSLFPPGVQRLDLAFNRLDLLPDNLPGSLVALDLTYNQLDALPNSLPRGLRSLNASYNRLTAPPDNLPPGLHSLDLSRNQIRVIAPHDILRLARLAPEAEVNLRGNPLSPETLQDLEQLRNAPAYRGPTIHFDGAPAHRPPPVQPLVAQNVGHAPGRLPPLEERVGLSLPTQAPPLARAVAAWMPAQDQGDVVRQWAGFSNDSGAESFAAFLHRLHSTINSSLPQFQASVTHWLRHLQENPSLRRDTFLVSEGATASCEDRVSHSFNAMRQLQLSSEVARGDYDQRLPELLDIARSMFRLGELEKVARARATQRPDLDEIEVYLAYQVQLRRDLALPLDTPGMAYPSMSGVTRQDLSRAKARVLSAERQHFSRFLSCDWQPWQAVLQRLAPQQHAQAQERLFDAMDGEFSHRLAARLSELGLQNDPDAERTMGPQIQAELVYEIKDPVTRDFLASRGLAIR